MKHTLRGEIIIERHDQQLGTAHTGYVIRMMFKPRGDDDPKSPVFEGYSLVIDTGSPTSLEDATEEAVSGIFNMILEHGFEQIATDKERDGWEER